MHPAIYHIHLPPPPALPSACPHPLNHRPSRPRPQRKADATDVLSAAQVEALVQRKFEEAMAHKAEADDVPSLSQHWELAAATERKLSFLADQLRHAKAGCLVCVSFRSRLSDMFGGMCHD